MYISRMSKPPKGLKRPRDPVQLGKLLGDILTGQVEDSVVDARNAAAVSLGSKGGKARANSLNKKSVLRLQRKLQRHASANMDWERAASTHTRPSQC